MIVLGLRLSQQNTMGSACGQFSLPRGWVLVALRASSECPEGRDLVPKVVCWNCCRHPAATNFLWDRAISVSSAENVVVFYQMGTLDPISYYRLSTICGFADVDSKAVKRDSCYSSNCCQRQQLLSFVDFAQFLCD